MRFVSKIFIAIAGLLVFGSAALALGVPPTPSQPVLDQTGTLNEQQVNALIDKINSERSKSSNQIAVLMIPSLEGEDIADYGVKVGRAWGVGEKDKNNGVLLIVAKNDHKVRIEVGYGLEGALPDARASRIIRDRITPQFKEGKFYEGIDSGLDGIILAVHNEYEATPQSQDQPPVSDIMEYIFWGILVLPAWLSSILARTKSWWAGGVVGAVMAALIGYFGGWIMGLILGIFLVPIGLLFDWAVSRNFHERKKNGLKPSWWAGGTTLGGGGSNGGGGFGGGSFGGGGSSGSW